jgi:hypothetical protein
MAYDKYNTDYLPPFVRYQKPEWLDFDVSTPKTVEPLKAKTSGIDESIFKTTPKENLNTQISGQEPVEKSEIGKNALNNIDGIIDFGVTAYSSMNGVASSKKENTANTIKMTSKGAELGMTVGGPIGAGIGAVVGLGAGLIDGAHDSKIRYQRMLKDNALKFDNAIKSEDNQLKIASGEKLSIADQATYNKQKRFI